MLVTTNASYNALINDYHSQVGKLHQSMKRLSTGNRILLGDSPADLGISERFRFQIKNGREAGRVIQNAINLMQSNDAWLQEVQNILGRMNELATASIDGSKSEQDRENLDLEFQQLKVEVTRISEAGKYNGLQVNGKTAVATWDSVEKRIFYSQPDGSDVRMVDVDLKDGSIATTGESISFESSANGYVGDFLFVDNGKSLLYIAQKTAGDVIAGQTVMKLDLETKAILKVNLNSAAGNTPNTQVRLRKDNDGRVWVSNRSSANGEFTLSLLNTLEMSLDNGSGWAGGVTMASTSSEFTVHGDYAYFIEKKGTEYQYVRQNIFDRNERKVIIPHLGSTIGLNSGGKETYAISPDGAYIAFKNVDDPVTPTKIENLVITNTRSGKMSNIFIGEELTSIVGLRFDANNKLYWTNTGDNTTRNSVQRLSIATGSDPAAFDIETIRTGSTGHFGTAKNNEQAAIHGMGLSVAGDSPTSNYQFQIGPESSMSIELGSADVRTGFLGISHLDVNLISSAQEAIEKISVAVDRVSNQRAIIGSQVSRLHFSSSANESFINNFSAVENRIRNVDFAEESAKMTEAQILAQASSAIVTQSKGFRANILQFLQ